MAFKLAEAYVQLSNRGMSGVMGGLSSIGQRLKSLISPANALTAALGALGTGLSVRAVLKSYATQEMAEKKVEAMVKASGQAAGFTADQLKEMASDLQKVTLHGDETTMQAQSMLMAFQSIKGDEFRDTIKAAADLDAIFGAGFKATCRSSQGR